MTHDFHKEYSFAKAIATNAAKIILKYYQTDLEINYKEGNSPLTIADIETEKFIRSSFETKFPNYGFLGEETEENVKDICWIVDPIDGTTAFSRGIDDFGTAIALKVGNEIIFSIETIPTKHQLYSAYKNEGAFCNDKKISVSKRDDIEKSLISLGGEGLRHEINHEVSLRLALNNRVRVAPSSMIESVYLASGKTDVVFRFKQKIWDIAPECFLMQEAGAIVTDHFRHKLQLTFTKDAKHDYIATNPLLASTYKDLLYSK